MEISTTRREHFRVKLESIDNDFNKWLEEKELSEEFNNNILSERPKFVPSHLNSSTVCPTYCFKQTLQ